MKHKTASAPIKFPVRRAEYPHRSVLSSPTGRLRIAIIGFGTVGRATADIIAQHGTRIEQRTGVRLQIAAVCRRSGVKLQDTPPGARSAFDWRELISADDVDVVVETMGSVDEAFQLVQSSLAAGKPVVTANKRLLAERGDELFAFGARQNLPIGFEASVAASIPIVRILRESTTGDVLSEVRGILNGTTNYILTEMERRGIELEQALIEAQSAGYAEADPALDINGFDTRDKIVILARMAFGGRLEVGAVPTLGIGYIRGFDIRAANRLDGCIRLLGSAAETGCGITISVRPRIVSRRSVLGGVEGVNNAVTLTGQKTGMQMFYGLGAGGDATATAVVSDLIEIARDARAGKLSWTGIPGFLESNELQICADSRPRRWYLRVAVEHEMDGATRVGEIIGCQDISLQLLQKESVGSKDLMGWVTTSPVSEAIASRAAHTLNVAEDAVEPALLLPIESSDSDGAA
jgi:homoserine dehydrogenase